MKNDRNELKSLRSCARVPHGKMCEVTAMLKAIHAQEDLICAMEKTKAVTAKLRSMKLSQAVEKVENGIEETFYLYAFSSRTLAKNPNQ